MDEPTFKARRKRELLAALKWGVSQLLLDNWTIKLGVDSELEGNLGSETHHTTTREAIVVINRKACRKDNVDPICTLFHELTHIVVSGIDPPKKAKEHTELLCNIVGKVLFELWEAEHGS